MHGIIFDMKRFEIHDGPGIRTTVFFKGCPLRCVWCHNPEGLNPEPESMMMIQRMDDQSFEKQTIVGRSCTVDELIDDIIRDRFFFEESGGGVTFSGGEPVMQFDFLKAVLTQCKDHSIQTCLDTCGYFSVELLEHLVPLVNLFLYDIKMIDRDQHIQLTGVENDLILENLVRLHKMDAEVILRFPVVPGLNDQEDHIDRMIEFFKPLTRFRRIDVLPYHDLAKTKYRKLNRDYSCKINTDEIQHSIREIKISFEHAGYEVIIGG